MISCLLLLIVCSGLQLPGVLMDCLPCSCHPDLRYGGTMANCSYKGLRRVSLPDPGNVTTLLFDYGNVIKLTISDFQGMTNLRHLSMRGSLITSIEEAPGAVFTNLEYLDLSQNTNLGVPQIVKMISWLRRGTLNTLFLDFITTLKSMIVPMDGVYCSYLQHTALREFHLDGNVFSYVGKSCFSYLPKTLEIFTARYTMLGDYDDANMTGISNLRHLRVVDVTGYTTWNPGQGHYRPWDKRNISALLPIMPSLEVVRLGQNQLTIQVMALTLLPIQNNLTTIDVSQNRISSFIGPLIGFDNVEYIDVSQNMIAQLGKTIFPVSNKVKSLNLSNNFLGQWLLKDTGSETFQQLFNLEGLDISKNRITSLPKKSFDTLVNIRYLDISGNYLTNFDIEISRLQNLTELNLKNNKLVKLPHRIIEQVNFLPNVMIIMDGNPLICSCDTLDFLEWMIDNKHIKPMDTQTCRLTNGSDIELQHLDKILLSLHKSCKSDLVLVAASVSGGVALLVLVAVFIGYRYRWKLKYMMYVGKKKYFLLNDQDDFDNFEYDAFISYADNDRAFVMGKMRVELEDKSGLKVCIHHRDFTPGNVITENILNAIQNSRKTVILLSPEFLKSEWCIHEFHMARQDEMSRKMNKIVVILLEEVDVKQLPKGLAQMMKTNSYLEYNTDAHGEEVFWSNLKEGIKTLKRLE